VSKKLEGKIAFVTDGSRGIGAAIAKRLAADGAKVAITYTKGADAAASVVKTIQDAGGKAIAIAADSTTPGAVEAAMKKTVATFGGLDVLVNNAGTAIPKKFEETTLEELDRVIDINIRGTFMATQAALKHMNNGGRIISIGSCVGERMMRSRVLRGHQGSHQDVHPRVGQRGRRKEHHGQQHPAGPDRYRSQSRRRRVGGPPEGAHGA
jgi:3-oxoacyl-[acyl-carrier protein] reductase